MRPLSALSSPAPTTAPPSSPNARRTLFALGAALALGRATRSVAAAPPSRAASAATPEPGYEWRPWSAQRPVPTLALSSLDGRPWRLADQRGRALVLNFWATWCGPCRDELPSLDRLARRLAQVPKGPRVLGVNYKESPDTIRRFLAGLPGVELPMLLDAQGTAMAAWTPRILPTTVLIDRSGRPLGSIVGEIDWDSAEAQARIAPLL